MLRVFALLSILLCATSAALAEKRVALVIGNSAYRNATPLKNPSNDAADVSKALEQLGFEVVVGQDLDATQMRRTVKQFADKLAGADVSLFFYAGHALQVRGENYLAPIDADLKKETDLDFETVSLDLVRRQMERETTTQLVFLDACRDNPLARSFQSRSRSSGDGQGLARLETSAEGTFIAFATQPDNVALDGDGRNSPFTKALLNHIHRPNIEISALMTEVRREVYDATEQQQLPWTNSSLLGAFFFKREEIRQTDAQRAAELERLDAENRAYEAIENSDKLADFENFLKQHPESIYEPLVRQAIVRLSGGETKVARLETPKPERSGDGAQPVTRQTEETPPTATATEDPAGKPQTQTAAVPDPDASTPVAADAPVSEPLTRSAIQSIQQELVRAGCAPGRPDGIWGRNSRRALEAFARNAKLDLASLEPSQEILDSLRERSGRICPAATPAAPPPAAAAPTREAPKAAPPARKQVQQPPAKRTANVERNRTRPAPKATTPRTRKPSGGACFRFNGQLICE